MYKSHDTANLYVQFLDSGLGNSLLAAELQLHQFVVLCRSTLRQLTSCQRGAKDDFKFRVKGLACEKLWVSIILEEHGNGTRTIR